MPLPSVLDEIDRLFDEMIHRRWGAPRQLVPAEIREVADGWMIEWPAAGLAASDLRIEVQGRQLTVVGQGTRRQQRAQGPGAWVRTQQHVAVRRSVTLPVAVRADDVEARVEDDTLRIHVRRPRR
jgi:HSP20 family molecular chaperone IbpA